MNSNVPCTCSFCEADEFGYEMAEYLIPTVTHQVDTLRELLKTAPQRGSVEQFHLIHQSVGAEYRRPMPKEEHV